jgi:hypothetical protein
VLVPCSRALHRPARYNRRNIHHLGVDPDGRRLHFLPNVSSRWVRLSAFIDLRSTAWGAVASGVCTRQTRLPESVTSVFSELEDYEAALRAEGCLSLLITERGRFRARLTQVTLHHLRLSSAEEQLSRIAFIEVPNDTVIISFPIGGGTEPVRGGSRIQPSEIMILGPGKLAHVRTDGPRRWGAVWVPLRELMRYGSALIGTPFAVPAIARRWRPPPSAGSACAAFMRPRSGWQRRIPKPLWMPALRMGWNSN